MTRTRRLLLLSLGMLPLVAQAWIYPEHRDIAALGVDTLDPERRAVFDRLWSEARTGHESRLCPSEADTAQGVDPSCIDWAAWSAIAGDHSCSSAQMLGSVLDSEWILAVAAVAAQLKVDLARVSAETPSVKDDAGRNAILDLKRQLESEAVRAKRANALRSADVRLQSADPEYATRAGSNNAHFLLARPATGTTAKEYLVGASAEGAEVNAIGVYARYHLMALQKATRLARETLTPEARSALARDVLADEAFALHFMEDAFASGHVAGTWGDASQRKGTHDYYNEHGLEVTTWQSGATSMVLLGDAHMRPEDAARAAATVRISLEQLLDTVAGRKREAGLSYVPEAPLEPGSFDVCKNNVLPPSTARPEAQPEVAKLGTEVLMPTPVPSLGPGLGSMPRYRAEVGPFIGIAGTLDARRVNGGFTGFENGNGGILGADLSVRAGLGLDGVLGEAGDGLIYLSLGYRGDGQSSNNFSDGALAQQSGSLAAAIPARSGISTRLRMPFYLLPGDMLLLLPIYPFSHKTYQDIAVTAANGGLLRWQLGWATRFGRFQFVAGREIGVAFYGVQGSESLFAPAVPPATTPRIVSYKSTFLDFPLLEFRPYRAFDINQTSELIMQLFYGIDIPSGGAVIYPAGMPSIGLKRVYSLGLRVVFDWRSYRQL